MHESFRLTRDESTSRKRLRKRPLVIHLLASAIGLVAFCGTFFFLYHETSDLTIFPDDKRYLGAVLCLIACANAHVFTYYLVKSLVRIARVLSPSDVQTLSPSIGDWPDQWYEDTTTEPTVHPLDKAS